MPFILHVPYILLFGLLFALLIPPFQSPDEPNHFYRAWQVSEGHFFPEKKGDRLGGMLPASLMQVYDSFHFLKNDIGVLEHHMPPKILYNIYHHMKYNWVQQ